MHSRYMSGSRLLDSGGRVKVRTSMLNTGVTALSVLSIDRVEQSDRGNYTCKPASGGEASISLHVLEGESFKIFEMHGLNDLFMVGFYG